MPTAININGKIVTRPGVYALTKSGIKNPPLNFSYGNICIIDDGIGATYGGGAGVAGTLSNGVDSVYEISTIQDFRNFVKGGELWNLAEALFKPGPSGVNGTSKVFLIRAAATTNAEIVYTFANGAVTFQTLDEGLNANGTLTSGILTKGYGCKIVESSINAGRFFIEFYVGTYKGIDPLNNIPYDGLTALNSAASLFLASPECETVQELIDWCLSSNDFKAAFQLKAGYIATGALVAADVTTNVGYKLASGGTETYNAINFDAALEAVKDLDNTFFLSTSYGITTAGGGTANGAINLNNTKIFDFIVNDSKNEKYLVIAAGYDKPQFAGTSNSSQAVAKFYNSDKVLVVHGGAKKTTKFGFSIKSQLWKAACILGRIAGLEPQVPVTFKSLSIDGEIHKLSDSEKEFALAKGILTTHYDVELGYYVVQQGINSLQNNQYLVNEDGSTFDIAVARIRAQLNKEIVINAKRVFFGKPSTGPNRNTVTEEDIKAWLEGFLQGKTASSLTDNLILRFGNITVTVQSDNYFISYEFVPNFPVNKLIFTGILLEN